jgi:hypothetical protein
VSQTAGILQTVALPLIAGLLPAAVSGIAAFGLARHNFRSELGKIQWQLDHQQKGQIATLRQRYINPLRYWASKLSRRLAEIEEKFDRGQYDQVRGWFKTIKDHADGNQRRNDFTVWCYYEGIFAITTLYFTCSYLQCAREISFRLPFSELDPGYSAKLDAQLAQVGDAMKGWENGIWDSAQEVLGERFTRGETKIDNEELCRILDSRDSFKVAPFVRVLDVYIWGLEVADVRRIRAALDELAAFVTSRRTPEPNLPPAQLA